MEHTQVSAEHEHSHAHRKLPFIAVEPESHGWPRSALNPYAPSCDGNGKSLV
jgi:hypothetical protein